MVKRIAMCSLCNSEIAVDGEPGQKIDIKCPNCNGEDLVTIAKKETPLEKTGLKELDSYPLNEPYAYVKILKDSNSLDKYYWAEEPIMKEDETKMLDFIQETLIRTMDVRLDQVESGVVENFLDKNINKIIKKYKINIGEDLKEKILYYIKRKFIGYGRIDLLMRDPNIEDISCTGPSVPIFLYHRKYDSLQSNIKFEDENELSAFVVKLSQKCGKHISKSTPMLDATMPDGSRIQMTLSAEVTTKGSTFTIRKFRSDPITPTDLIEYNTMSPELIAYMWMAVENGINALIAGGTASGKTSTLNALALFIPRESKIVSIEETREINLPHKNWIPGVTRVGFGERIKDRLIGEIDLFDLMKAALRQRPEYILVGEIRGREAYVLFQAMATGHTTYSTVHADSAKSLIHRLEGKPIEIPRALLQSLDIVLIQTNTKHEDRNVRRCKQIIEIIDIDSLTDEILTNEAFHWDPVEDEYIFSGKSYVLERLRTQLGMSTEEMTGEISRRVEILKWMHKNKIRVFNDVAKIVSSYVETPDELIAEIRKNPIKIKEKDNGTSYIQKSKETGKLDVDMDNVATEKKKITFSSLLFNKREKKDKVTEKSKEKKNRGIGASETPIQNKKNMKLEDENDSNKATKI
jgi:flagellar protein FlaI